MDGVLCKSSLQLLGEGLNLTGLNVRFGGIISNDLYKENAKYGVIVLDSPISGEVTKEMLQGYLDTNYAKEITPVKVSSGYQFAWVITNLEKNEVNYTSLFYAYMYELNGDVVSLSQVKSTSVNDIIEDYVMNNEEYGISYELADVMIDLMA